ncbi:MAG: protein kinase [Acidobacteria bacterium]|nr:protein kinase [Acidobacteriota bacterium]
MPLNPGEKLGPYEIHSLIGEGGMGEVYRARDPRLDRSVAVKVSKEQFTDRFEREARSVAALNHTNICQIYDVGPNYLVMEFVEGPTLADRMRGGPVPLDEAVAIGRQIAEAIEAAHERGIIHRDLKPDNVKLTADHGVKVLDFGLAKARDPMAVEDPGSAPTIKATPSLAGMVIGTPGYMSPEQARGLAVDARTDVWAFGVVLWEMVTGRRMFEGDTVSDTLASVLKQDINLDAAPVELRPLLRRCLDRDRKQRLQSIGEARILLANPPAAAPAPVAQARRSYWAPVAIAALLGLIASLATLWRVTRPVERPFTTFDIDLGMELANTYMAGASTILSPDGRRIVFMDSGRRLWTRRLDQPKPTMIPGTEDTQGPFFSPDGRSIGFFSGGKLRKTQVEGGASIPLADSPAGGSRGGTWGEDGYITFSPSSTSALFRIPAAGGPAVEFTKLDAARKEVTHRWPQALPSGNAILFTAGSSQTNFDAANIEVQTINGGRKLLIEGGTFARYLPSGHLLYVNRATVFAVPFDVRRLEVTGPPAPVVFDIQYTSTLGYAQFDVSRDGKAVVRHGGTQDLKLQWLSESGETKVVSSKPLGNATSIRISPDGKRMAYSAEGSIWVYEFDRETTARLTIGSALDDNPVWNNDGSLIVFRRPEGLFSVTANGGASPTQLLEGRDLFPSSFSPDGRWLLAFGSDAILAFPIEGQPGQRKAGKPTTVVHGSSPGTPLFSPGGRWIAYSSTESGTREVFVRAWPESTARWQISVGGGRVPMWSPVGQELLWRDLGEKLFAAGYSARGDAFLADKPRMWASRQVLSAYDLSRDGKHILTLMPVRDAKPVTQVRLMLNFFDELKRLTR